MSTVTPDEMAVTSRPAPTMDGVILSNTLVSVVSILSVTKYYFTVLFFLHLAY